MDTSVTVVVLPGRDELAGGKRVWDLRALRVVAIPEGIERIGDGWFAGSDVESAEIPVSVKEIGDSAFCGCRRL